jgi:hypothetical protein
VDVPALPLRCLGQLHHWRLIYYRRALAPQERTRRVEATARGFHLAIRGAGCAHARTRPCPEVHRMKPNKSTSLGPAGLRRSDAQLAYDGLAVAVGFAAAAWLLIMLGHHLFRALKR